MKTTENYGLYLTDDSSEKFLDWREKMNGLDNSNMTKIDEALTEKAQHSTTVATVLKSGSWEKSDDIYVQTITIDSLSTTQNGYIFVSPTASEDQRMVAIEANLYIVQQADSSLTIGAYDGQPLLDIPVCITLFD